jgi:hypothetical protein
MMTDVPVVLLGYTLERYAREQLSSLSRRALRLTVQNIYHGTTDPFQ